MDAIAAVPPPELYDVAIRPVDVTAPAFHTPVGIVPTVAMSVQINFDAAIEPANIVLVTFPAPMATVMDVAPDPDTLPDNVIV